MSYVDIRPLYPQINIAKIRDDHYADDTNSIWIYSETGVPNGEEGKWSVSVRPELLVIYGKLALADSNMISRNEMLEDAIKLARLLVIMRTAYTLIDVNSLSRYT